MSNRDHPCTTPDPSLVLDEDEELMKCLSCGAFQYLNPDSGNITWIRSGRVISAPQDLLEAKERHDSRYGTDHASRR